MVKIYLILGGAVVVSQPHFYQGEEKLWKMVDGMSNPALNTSRYETFSYIEPYTGVSLKAHARLQVFPYHSSARYHLYPIIMIKEINHCLISLV